MLTQRLRYKLHKCLWRTLPRLSPALTQLDEASASVRLSPRPSFVAPADLSSVDTRLIRSFGSAMTWRAPLFCVLAAAWAATAASQTRPVQSDQQILIALEHDWDDAFYRKDLRFIEHLLADEYVATYDDGTQGDRAKELTQTADFNQQVDSSILDDFTVKVYGDTAVVRFTKHLAGPSQGVRHEVTYRSIDVFVWRTGRWQCVATQSTKVAKGP